MTDRSEPLKKQKRHISRPLWVVCYVVLALVILFLIGLLLVKSSYLNVIVSGTSMEDTISDGDALYASKYRGKVEHGDIAVIDVSDLDHFQKAKTSYIIKRVIAMEGDTVRIAGGSVYVWYAGAEEEIKLDEPYAKGRTEAKNQTTLWTLGEGEIFVLGDNREISDDSRTVGLLEQDSIIGIVLDWNFEAAHGGEAFTSFFIRGYLDIIRIFS